jgi:hypothetical protein
MAVYVDHFHAPYPRDARGDCAHYIGFCDVFSPSSVEHVVSRQEYHLAGRGSRLLAAVAARGIGWRTTRIIWHGTRTLERQMKRQRNAARFCPECNPKLRRYRTRADRWTFTPSGIVVPDVLTDDAREGMLSM